MPRWDDYGGPAVTLADLQRAGADLKVWCHACARHAEIPLSAALERWPFGTPIPSIRARCNRCGASVPVEPEYHLRGYVPPT